MARIVRGRCSLRSRGLWTQAERSVQPLAILFRHPPNVSGVVIVYLMLMVPSIILYESFLAISD
jgi:ABC-type dipeptide/oligopeptide/nickel transport system permease subunit